MVKFYLAAGVGDVGGKNDYYIHYEISFEADKSFIQKLSVSIL